MKKIYRFENCNFYDSNSWDKVLQEIRYCYEKQLKEIRGLQKKKYRFIDIYKNRLLYDTIPKRRTKENTKELILKYAKKLKLNDDILNISLILYEKYKDVLSRTTPKVFASTIIYLSCLNTKRHIPQCSISFTLEEKIENRIAFNSVYNCLKRIKNYELKEEYQNEI